jgi:hypothetical protein
VVGPGGGVGVGVDLHGERVPLAPPPHGWPGVAAPGGKQQCVEVSLGRLLVVYLESAVVAGEGFSMIVAK